MKEHIWKPILTAALGGAAGALLDAASDGRIDDTQHLIRSAIVGAVLAVCGLYIEVPRKRLK